MHVGSDLSVCRNDGLQCCLQSHIDAVTDVARNRLSLGLRLQMRETSLKFNATVDGIKECKCIIIQLIQVQGPRSITVYITISHTCMHCRWVHIGSIHVL